MTAANENNTGPYGPFRIIFPNFVVGNELPEDSE